MDMDEKKLAVRQMQDYIEAHLHETITLKQLADVCYLSPSYASKLFKDYTGYTPYYYIKACRLSEAARLLRDEKVKVLDVALDYVFDSHEGFTRAFTKQFGLPPKRYAQEKPPVKWFLPYPVRTEKKE
jgi:AraC-like DNA-binding protein